MFAAKFLQLNVNKYQKKTVLLLQGKFVTTLPNRSARVCLRSSAPVCLGKSATLCLGRSAILYQGSSVSKCQGNNVWMCQGSSAGNFNIKFDVFLSVFLLLVDLQDKNAIKSLAKIVSKFRKNSAQVFHVSSVDQCRGRCHGKSALIILNSSAGNKAL